jgi:hypothetical protein
MQQVIHASGKVLVKNATFSMPSKVVVLLKSNGNFSGELTLCMNILLLDNITKYIGRIEF